VGATSVQPISVFDKFLSLYLPTTLSLMSIIFVIICHFSFCVLLLAHCLCVCGTRVLTQGLHRELLHQPLFVKGFLEIGSHELFA
jgi:hypothetical protein